MKKLSFTKEYGTWYINLWYWIGPKAALAMVAGADDFLDKLTLDGKHATVKVYRKKQPNAIRVQLIEPNKLDNGGDYIIEGPKGYPKKMWLCNVTRVVYGGFMPKQLYVINASTK